MIITTGKAGVFFVMNASNLTAGPLQTFNWQDGTRAMPLVYDGFLTMWTGNKVFS